MLGLHCYTVFSLVAASGGYYLVEVLRLLIVVTSLAVEHALLLGGFSSCDTWAQ